MKKTLRLDLNQRAVVFHDGLPQSALGPGRHVVRGRDIQVSTFDTSQLVLNAPAAVRAVLPDGWLTELKVGADERAVLLRDGRVVQTLSTGVHRYWTVDEGVEVRIFSVAEAPPSEPDLVTAFGAEILQVLVGQTQRGLLYVAGRFERVLGPGRHLFWNTRMAPTSVDLMDMRRRMLPIAGQELMTRDKVTLRLSLLVEWAPMDPELHARISSDPTTAMHAMAQLALRDFVAGVSLDELLEGRDALTRFLEGRVVPEAAQLGAHVTRVGVKDIILPGDMKGLMNRVIEAEKQATVTAILRKEEVAQNRLLASAAQQMADRPMLLRLKELEALKDIAGRIDEMRVVIGADGLEGVLTPGRSR